MKLQDLSRPVRYLYVCENGHVGPAGRKSRPDQVKTQPCFECGEPAELKPVSPSGKARRRKKLPDTLYRPEEEFAEAAGPVIESEPFPVDDDGNPRFELSEEQLRQFENGEVPTIAFDRSMMPPLSVGALYMATDDLDIFITGYLETDTHLVARFDIHRSEQVVRADAVQIDRRHLRVPITNTHTGKREDPEPETEPVTKKDASLMTREVHEERLRQQKKDCETAEAWVRDLEKRYTKNETWPARQQLNRLNSARTATEERIREIDKGLRARKAA